MIFLPNIDALILAGVFDRGIPNKERIMIRVLKSTEMAQYGVLLGWNIEGQGAPTQPYNDNFYWFGDGVVQPNDTIFLYTGAGEPRKTTVEGTGTPAYVLHWGRPFTLFADSSIVPMVVCFGHMLIEKPAPNAPQLKQLING